jgi:hypothetical protein
MTIFNVGDRVIHDNGQYGTVIRSWCSEICTDYVTVKWDDGTIKTVHRCYLGKVL